MLKPPPRNAQGQVTPHDHAEIGAADGVIRRISERQVVKDANGVRRVSSIAFNPSGGSLGGMSIDLEALIVRANLDPMMHVTTPQWTGSVRFVAGQLRDRGFQVGYDPIDEEDGSEANPFHGEVWGSGTRARRKELHAMAEWFVQIPGVELHES